MACDANQIVVELGDDDAIREGLAAGVKILRQCEALAGSVVET